MSKQYSSRDPHRPFKSDGWKDFGTDIEKIVVPPYLPDHQDVKKDMGDYYAEIQTFDRDVSFYLQLLKEMGELENTLIIVCSDNGWQMPRGLANLYDFAPTFLELAGVKIPEEMNARSFLNILQSEKEGNVDETRDFVISGRERHAFARKNGTGYGARSIRTKDFLYIKNYEYESWPAGDPPLYGDVDTHMLHYPCAAKMYMLKNKDKDGVIELFDLGFGMRPEEELYDLKNDPFQMHNVAYSSEYKQEKEILSDKLSKYLKSYGDPRELGEKMKWIGAKYFADKDFFPRPSAEAKIELNLEEEYSLLEN